MKKAIGELGRWLRPAGRGAEIVLYAELCLYYRVGMPSGGGHVAKGGKETSKGRVSAAARCLHSCILKILIAANTLVRFEHGFEVMT